MSVRDLSGGGMSIQFPRLPKVAQADKTETKFIVPPGHGVSVWGAISWVHAPDNLIGVQFLPEPEPLVRVRAWIDDYLGIR